LEEGGSCPRCGGRLAEVGHAVDREDPAPESRLAAVRVARGLSQEDLALFAGLTINTVRGIEHSRMRPTPSARRALAEELEVSED